MNRQEAHKLVDQLFDSYIPADTSVGVPGDQEVVAEVTPERVLPEGKRVVRTKSSGDRVYLLDDISKKRQWVTNQEVLTSLGYTMADVVEIDDTEIMSYNMGAALYRIDG